MNQNQRILLFFITVVSVCFGIVVYRAYNIGITHDEAFSFLLIDTNYINALATTANTHILNSLSMKIFNLLNLNHWFFLRVHSILSFLVYAFFVYKILRFFKTSSSKITFITLMICNPFVLEFFSLARGYGISMAFLTAAIFHALSYLQNHSSTNLRKLLLFSSLAMLGNYTVLYPLAGIFIYLFWIQKKALIQQLLERKTVLLSIIYLIINLGAAVNMLLIKHITNDLQYGADQSFLFESLPSLFLNTAFIPFPSQAKTIETIGIMLSFFTFFLMVNTFIISLLKKNKLLGFATSVFLLSFLFYSLSHWIFSTPYPLSRTSLNLFPFIALNLIIWIELALKNKWLKTTIKTSSVIFLIYFSIQNFSLNHTLEWRNQSEVQYVFEETIKIHQQKSDKQPVILCDEAYYAVWTNYYSRTNHFKQKINIEYINKNIHDNSKFVSELNEKDYFIVTRQHYRSYYDDCQSLLLLKEFPQSETKLFCVIH